MKRSLEKFRFLMLWMVFSVWSAQAEFVPPINFGSMYLSEYQIPHSNLDSAFGAVILFNYTNRYITKGDYSVVVRETKRIKILNEIGMNFSNLNITNYDFNREDVVIYVHNLEGQQIVTRKINANDLKKLVLQYKGQQNIPLPFVKVGSVIETDITSYQELPNYLLLEFDIPCIWTGVRMVYYPEDSVELVYQGMDKPDMYIQKRIHSELLKEDVVERVMIMNNLPGSFETKVKFNYNLVNELKAVFFKVQRKNNLEDLISYEVEGALVGFEPNLDFWEYLNQYSSIDSGSIKRHLNEILKPEMSALEKSKAIHHFVSQSYTFNSEYNWFRQRSIKKLDSLKNASAGDLNMLLYKMHKMAGIEAWPIFIGVRNTPRMNLNFSMMWNMNHFLVRVMDTLHGPILDATNPILSYGILPEYVYNYTSMQLNTNSVYSFLLNPDSIKNTSRRYTEIQVIGKTLQYDCRWIPGIYEQAAMFASAPKRDSVLSAKGPILDKTTNWTIANYQWTRINEQGENPECQYRLLLNDMPERITVNPSAGFVDEFPFPEQYRKTAIQFPYAMNNKETIIIQLPPELEIEKIPESESFRFEENNLTFEYSIDTSNTGQIEIRMNHQVNHTFYDSLIYPEIRMYFEAIYKKRSEAIVLRRRKQ